MVGSAVIAVDQLTEVDKADEIPVKQVTVLVCIADNCSNKELISLQHSNQVIGEQPGSQLVSSLSSTAPPFQPLQAPPRLIPQQVLSNPSHLIGNNTRVPHISTCKDITVNPQRLMMISGSIVQPDVPMQGRSMTLSSHGSPARSPAQKAIMRRLQGVVRDYQGLGLPSAASPPPPEFPQERPSSGPLNWFAQVEMGMHQMLEVITKMSDTALLDQESWVTNQGGTTTINK